MGLEFNKKDWLYLNITQIFKFWWALPAEGKHRLPMMSEICVVEGRGEAWSQYSVGRREGGNSIWEDEEGFPEEEIF